MRSRHRLHVGCQPFSNRSTKRTLPISVRQGQNWLPKEERLATEETGPFCCPASSLLLAFPALMPKALHTHRFCRRGKFFLVGKTIVHQQETFSPKRQPRRSPLICFTTRRTEFRPKTNHWAVLPPSTRYDAPTSAAKLHG